MKKVNSNYNYSYENIAENFETLDKAVKELNEKIPEDYAELQEDVIVLKEKVGDDYSGLTQDVRELQADTQSLLTIVGNSESGMYKDVETLKNTANQHTTQIGEINTNLGYLSDTKANHFNEHIIKLSLTGAFIMDLSLRLITGTNIGNISTYNDLVDVINNVYGVGVEIPTSGTQLDTSNNNIIVVSSIYYDNATTQLVAKGLSTITMTIISQFGLGGCTVTDTVKSI